MTAAAERVRGTYVWTKNVPAALADSQPMLEQLKDRAVRDAQALGHEPIDGPVTLTMDALSPGDVALMARVDTEPGSEWYGLPAEVIEAEVAAREEAARNLRAVRIEVPVLAEPDTGPGLRQLGADAAAEVMRLGLEADAGRVAGAGLVCGAPGNRHDFLQRFAELLRDGRIPEATCQKCERVVPRAELVENAQAEARGDRWWEA